MRSKFVNRASIESSLGLGGEELGVSAGLNESSLRSTACPAGAGRTVSGELGRE